MTKLNGAEDFIHMPIPISMFTAVCAVIGQAALINVVKEAAKLPGNPVSGDSVKGAVVSGATHNDQINVATEIGDPNDNVSFDRPSIDADGHPFDFALHTGTLTKAGLWRMKAGVRRPAPLPGFPKETPTGVTISGTTISGITGTTSLGTASPAPAIASTPDAGADDEDEFAAFAAAAAANSASAPVPARKWTDADLGALTNQAAVKLGNPTPIKEIIAQFVRKGEIPHSRNIPADKREDFAKAVEAKAGIVFAG